MSAVRGVGGREVPGANPVLDAVAEEAKKKKNKRRGGKSNKKKKKTKVAPVPEHSPDSTSGAEAGSESSLRENGVDADDGSEDGFHKDGVVDKVTGKRHWRR